MKRGEDGITAAAAKGHSDICQRQVFGGKFPARPALALCNRAYCLLPSASTFRTGIRQKYCSIAFIKFVFIYQRYSRIAHEQSKELLSKSTVKVDFS